MQVASFVVEAIGLFVAIVTFVYTIKRDNRP